MKEIVFIEGENFDGQNKEIYFHAKLTGNDTLVRCCVPSEVLRDYLGASCTEQHKLTVSFRNLRHEIEKIAECLIQTGRYESDGTIIIRRQDFLIKYL